MQLPEASLERLIQMYRTLSRMMRYEPEVSTISSAQLGELIGVPSHTVRKDISCLGEIGSSGRGYEIEKLWHFIASELGLQHERRAAVVGLGKIGTALLEYERFKNSGFTVVAGFDSDINRLDTIHSPVPVYPAYRITEVVEKEKIELAFLAVPASAAHKTVERLVLGGIQGIVNFSPLVLQREGVFVRNVDLTGELTLLSALISVNSNKK